MKKLCLKNIEIGQLISNQPTGIYEVPRRWQDSFQEFLAAAGFDNYGHIENDRLEEYLKMDKGEAYYPRATQLTPEFIMQNGLFSHIGLNRSDEFYFYNGKLYCIYEDYENTYYEDYDRWEEAYDEALDKYLNASEAWFDANKSANRDETALPLEIQALKPSISPAPKAPSYKINYVQEMVPHFEHDHYFDNGTFLVRPYYWGDAEYIKALPNFIYYPKNIQIYWYKYPFRGASCNKNISEKEFHAILQACKASL